MPRAGANIDESYEEAVRFLGTFINFEKAKTPEGRESIALDVAAYRAVLRELGDPHLQYTVVHVAGSKGKGSTTSFVARILREAGLKTGLLISPHLVDFTERASVDGVDISREEFGRLIALLRRTMEDGGDESEPNPVKRVLQSAGLMKKPPQLRHFRNAHGYWGGVALLHFAREKVDAAVVEVGMGGRLDHTNIFDEPPRRDGDALVTPLTAMAIEHRQMLGDNIPSISRHKAGIIRPHGLAVLGPQKSEWYADVAAAVEERVREIGAPPVLDTNKAIIVTPGSERVAADGTGAEFRCDGAVLNDWLGAVGCRGGGAAAELVEALTAGLRLWSPLPGHHQMENLRTVLGTVIALGARGVRVPLDAVVTGIAETRWPARFEVISKEPLVIVDCCHEPLSIEAFSRTFRELYGDREVIGVIGFLRDNDIPAMCKAMVPHLNLKHVVCCMPPLPVRQRKAKSSIKYAQPVLQVPMTAIDDMTDAMRCAFDMRRGDQALLVYGDMYIAGTARVLIPELLAKSRGT